MSSEKKNRNVTNHRSQHAYSLGNPSKTRLASCVHCPLLTCGCVDILTHRLYIRRKILHRRSERSFRLRDDNVVNGYRQLYH